MAQPALSPSGTGRINIRAPKSLTDELAAEANRRGVDRSTLVRDLLAEKLNWSEET